MGPTQEFTQGVYDYVVKLQGQEYPLQLENSDLKVFRILLDGSSEPHMVDMTEYPIDHPILVSFHNDDDHVISQVIAVTPLGFQIQFVGSTYDVEVLGTREAQLLKYMKEPTTSSSINFLLSPMAGTLVSLAVTEGDVVTHGQELAVVEAMKMQNQLRSQRHGKVKKINYKPGDSVLSDVVILEFFETPEK